MDLHVSDADLAVVRRMMKTSKDYNRILQQAAPTVEYDTLRQQCFADHRRLMKTRVMKNLVEVIRSIDMEWIIEELVFLKSLPGGPTQFPHQDVTVKTFAEYDPSQTPGAVIVSVMENSSLLIWDGCFRSPFLNVFERSTFPRDFASFSAVICSMVDQVTTTSIIGYTVS